MRYREEVEHGIGRSAGRRDGSDCVVERLPRHDPPRAQILRHQVHYQLARAARASAFSAAIAGTPFALIGETPSNAQTVDIVLAVN